MAEKDKPKPIDYDIIINDLIKKIDNEKPLFKFRDYVRALSSFILIAVLLLFIVLSNYYSSSISSSDGLVIVFAALAVLLAFGQFALSAAEGRIIDTNYNRVLTEFNVSKEEKPLLKALVKMKSENIEFTLAEICKISPEMFTKDKLLEKLYK